MSSDMRVPTAVAWRAAASAYDRDPSFESHVNADARDVGAASPRRVADKPAESGAGHTDARCRGVIGDAAGSGLRAQEAGRRRQTGVGVPVPERRSGFEAIAAGRFLLRAGCGGSTRTGPRMSPSAEGCRQHADAEGAGRGIPRPARRGTGRRSKSSAGCSPRLSVSSAAAVFPSFVCKRSRPGG
jgi:hypothetical protein